MSVTKEEVKHIAKLAKLDPTEEELERYVSEFTSILNYFSEMNELNLSDIDTNLKIGNKLSDLPEDNVNQFENRDKILKSAGKEREKTGYIKVKRKKHIEE